MAMLDDKTQAPADGRTQGRPLHCQECTIQIGDGYQESVAFEFVDESSSHPKVLKVCWRCLESLNRRKAKRLAQTHQQSSESPR